MLSRWYEKWWGRSADYHLCVTQAMRAELTSARWGLPPARVRVLHDRPPDIFQSAATSASVSASASAASASASASQAVCKARHELWRRLTRDGVLSGSGVEWAQAQAADSKQKSAATEQTLFTQFDGSSMCVGVIAEGS